MAYEFDDPRCGKLYNLASPCGTKHKHAFAWREDPARLEKFWNSYVKRKFKADSEIDEFIKMLQRESEAQTRYRQEQIRTGEFLPRPKGIAVWFNAGGWGSTVGSHAELKQKQAVIKCACGAPALSAGDCAACNLKKHRDWREEILAKKQKEFGLEQKKGESVKDLAQRSISVNNANGRFKAATAEIFKKPNRYSIYNGNEPQEVKTCLTCQYQPDWGGWEESVRFKDNYRRAVCQKSGLTVLHRDTNYLSVKNCIDWETKEALNNDTRTARENKDLHGQD